MGKQYHTGELSVPKVPEPDQAATRAPAKNKGPGCMFNFSA